MRVLIADDHAILRDGLRSLLTDIDDVSVVADTGAAAKVLPLVKKFHPDVILMDISMPRENGIELVRKITRKFSNIAVIMLSMYTDQDHVLRSLRAGAKGYVSKESAIDELSQALKAVGRGGMFLSPVVSTNTLLSALVGGDTHADDGLDRLTSRQGQVLRLLVTGKSTKEAAHILGISVKTVESHRAQIMERLQIFNVAGLVRFAVRRGLVRLD